MALLTPQELVDRLQIKLQDISKHNGKLFPEYVKSLKTYQNCMESQRKTFFEKNRARGIMAYLLKHMPEVFFLCSLVVTPTDLGKTSLKDCLKDIQSWWDTLPPHPALTNVFEEARNSGHFPNQQGRLAYVHCLRRTG
jgi:hypothetical protein